MAGWLGKVVRYEVWLVDALCLVRIESNWGRGGKGVCISPMSEEEEEKERGRKYTPEQARQINFASQQHMHCCFLFLFPSSSLFRLRKEIRK